SALARHPAIEAIPVLDERSAAFFALGRAKRTSRPAVLVCTSGTAAANYLPAIVEAHESGVPLLVFTADRPPELRDCASGQTIDQQKLFGGYVGFYHELAVPEPRLELLRYLRQTIARACARATGPGSGPVHLNAPFRDPLPPIVDASAEALRGAIDEDFFAHVAPTNGCHAPADWAPPASARGVIVAGPATPADPAAYAREVGRIARTVGWPVLADALSPVRHHATEGACVVAHYDALLRDEKLAASLRPEAVLCLEGWPTSKVLRTWLERSGAEVTLVSAHPANRDGLHQRTRQIAADIAALAIDAVRPESEYVALWSAAETNASDRIGGSLASEAEFFEPKATWLLANNLPEATPVFVASSMPVRDVEYFWPQNERRARLFFNRGANGIDGTLSTALGVAHGGEPALLLTGDLSLLHDTNGLLLRPKFRGSLTIALIDNNGGGIFEHLPVAQFEPPFETFFATPQQVDFAALCAAYGVGYVPVRDWEQFAGLVRELPANGIRVLHVRTDRKKDAARRKALLNGVRA
ncbi:MAG TPA: 2-succinyl-5-enolpyruvyl-6-hydroxy-3-cyclohexene-1-carboxylic-acid synthase, partial [Opitutaceae bacterium]|nr:2-succinyl-5-enolpyruvyl-6-hydroxy-3-cyclohexene-1-carboxylic-acid synthase [Opitutaceae bacterium]